MKSFKSTDIIRAELIDDTIKGPVYVGNSVRELYNNVNNNNPVYKFVNIALAKKGNFNYYVKESSVIGAAVTYHPDLLSTQSNCCNVELGEVGYAGCSINDVNYAIIVNDLVKVVNVDDMSTNCFTVVKANANNAGPYDYKNFGFFIAKEVIMTDDDADSYRPFANIHEFCDFLYQPAIYRKQLDFIKKLLVTDVVIRRKPISKNYDIYDDAYIVKHLRITGISDNEDTIYLDYDHYSFKRLFAEYEICINNRWLPFGKKI